MDIRVDSARSMLEQGYRLTAYCDPCGVSREVDLAKMVAEGRGDVILIRRRWRCKNCGAIGCVKLGPPAPQLPDNWAMHLLPP